MLPHEPIFASEDDATRSYLVCGKIAVNWGPVELAIESLILMVRSRQGVFHPTPFPASLSKKITELKERVRDAPQLTGYRKHLTQLLSLAKTLHQTRVIVVHGICQGTNLKGEIMFGISDLNNGVSYRPKNMTHSELERVAESMIVLARDLLITFNEARAYLDGENVP